MSQNSLVAPTIHDVARECGVSVTTVSVALSGNGRLGQKTRSNVIEMAREMGYEANQHARGLRGQGSQEIGLFTLDLDMGVGTRKLQMIQHELSAMGYTVPIYAYGYRYSYVVDEWANQQTKLVRALCRQKPRAIICHAPGLQPAALAELQRFHGAGGVLVCDCYGQPLDIDCDQVIFDEADNTYQAARHLLQLGHRAIGLFIVGKTEPVGPRLDGFARALAEFGLVPDARWMLRGNKHGDSEEDGVDAAREFLALGEAPGERPSAMCIVNDRAAVAFCSEVQNVGVAIPAQLSVVGHDNSPIARFGSVALSTVSHPIERIAQSIIALLLGRIEGQNDEPPQRIWVRGELVQRQSSAAPTS